jgi:hypothetical protein
MRRAERLQRLLVVRRVFEHVERRKLQGALTSVTQVEAALDEQAQAIDNVKVASANSLGNSNHDEWLFAEAQMEIAGWNRSRLMPILEMRRALIPQTTADYLERHLEVQQVEHLVEHVASLQRRDQERHAQAVSDDCLLARIAAKRRQ